MNQEKARDLFSAYLDGSLEPGLRQQFEKALSMDAGLKADYAAFSHTMLQLDQLQFEEIEIPIFLHDRIATRLEADEATRKKSGGFFGNWLRGLAFSGLATAAIVGAVVAIKAQSDTANAGIFGSIPNLSSDSTTKEPGNLGGPSSTSPSIRKGLKSQLPANLIAFKVNNSQVFLQYRSDRNAQIKISAVQTGKLIKRFDLNRNALSVPLKNDFANTALIQVTSSTEETPAVVALPGSSRSVLKTNGGTIYDFAGAIAAKYGVPVVVRAPQSQRFSWTLDSDTAREATEKGLIGRGFSVDQREGGLLTILPH